MLPELGMGAGSVFWVPLYIENAIEMQRWEAVVVYDPSVITPTGQVAFTLFLRGAALAPDFREGRLILRGLSVDEPASGDGWLAFIEFVALRPGTGQLELEDTSVLSPDGSLQPHTTTNGHVMVLESAETTPSPTTMPTPTPVPTPTHTPTPTAPVSPVESPELS
jgi:hypothetical protein